MKAKVKQAFPGRPDNEVRTRTIEAGEIIEGDLATVAVREKWAEEVAENELEQGKPSLDDMSVDDLMAYAEENNIELGDAKKKADIRAAIDLALEAGK